MTGEVLRQYGEKEGVGEWNKGFEEASEWKCPETLHNQTPIAAPNMEKKQIPTACGDGES